MRSIWIQGFRHDTGAMEEIGFIYVFGLSVILLSAIFYTISDTTKSRKELATKAYLEDEVERISGVVQIVIDMQLNHPGINYTRIIHLSHPDQIYQYRIELSQSRVFLVSRVEEITASAILYNPMEINIDSVITGDAKAFSITYESSDHSLNIQIINPDLQFV